MIHYPEYILDIIWQRAKKISADNETKGFRKDKETKWIKRQMFNQQNEFGWVLSKQPSSIHQLIEDETIVPLHWQKQREPMSKNKKQALNVSI
ncbi:hypothetical protein [Proteus mirabilis]|uniref:hypothetical protein n=1 Tax=Proteus mirabilis TaxID=584 RepID=UPI0020C7EEDB|nr:hypothetical protein [Proteus mirabilis]